MALFQAAMAMLRQRIITALVLAGILLASIVFLPLPGLALLFAVFVGLGAWEWSRMAGWQSVGARALYTVVFFCACGVLYVYCQFSQGPSRELVQPFLGLACLWWSFVLLWIKGYPASAVFWRSTLMRSFMGYLILVPAWLAALYMLSYPRGGQLFVALVLIVAAADIGAYFAGRALGKHKLARSVSPAKTWEGFWGGMLVCGLLAVAMWYWLPERATHLSMSAVITVVMATALASVVGDLAVSMVKRESGIKDSGNILPGHGGVLDRLDSLCGAAPVFALGLLLAGWQ
jgi:phosphatidate cytidylyltransferase